MARRDPVRSSEGRRVTGSERRDDRNWGRRESYGNRSGSSSWRGGNHRGDGRSYSSSRERSHPIRRPYYASGRVTRINPYRGGYRLWVVGAPYPFFIPHSHYNRNRFRVGLNISLGGYYNPLGYYDFYDGYSSRYYDRYSDARAYSTGTLRGVVESVDYRRETFVVRNDSTGSFVTVAMRERRRDLQAGDYVELSGRWSRSGLFEAYDIDLLDDGYGR